MQIIDYQTDAGIVPYRKWFDGLRDTRAQVAILRRIDRLAQGHFGEHRFLRDGVWELKISVGPSYRVYYAQTGKAIVLLLCGGSKRTQRQDINRAVDYWNDYSARL